MGDKWETMSIKVFGSDVERRYALATAAVQDAAEAIEKARQELLEIQDLKRPTATLPFYPRVEAAVLHSPKWAAGGLRPHWYVSANGDPEDMSNAIACSGGMTSKFGYDLPKSIALGFSASLPSSSTSLHPWKTLSMYAEKAANASAFLRDLYQQGYRCMWVYGRTA